MILLRGLGDVGDASESAYDTATWGATLFGAGMAPGQDTTAPASAPTSAGFDWAGLVKTGASTIAQIFGAKPIATITSADIAATAAAQQAAQTRNLMMIGGVVLAAGAGYYLLKRRKR
jgi:LPXTG-motif cell wall-anchored protein